MSGIIGTLANGFTWVGQWIVSAVTTVWGAILLVLDAILGVVVALIGVLGTVIVSIFGVVLTVLLAALPDVPEPDHAGVSGISALAAANQYVPVAEALTLLPVVGAIAGGIGVYKLAKFIRGGG